VPRKSVWLHDLKGSRAARGVTVGKLSTSLAPPGLVTSARQGCRPNFAYFNATSSVCVRKIKNYHVDSQKSSTGNTQTRRPVQRRFRVVARCQRSTTRCRDGLQIAAYGSGAIASTEQRARLRSHSGRKASPSPGPRPRDGLPSSDPRVRFQARGSALPKCWRADDHERQSFMKGRRRWASHYVYSAALSVTEFKLAPSVAGAERSGSVRPVDGTQERRQPQEGWISRPSTGVLHGTLCLRPRASPSRVQRCERHVFLSRSAFEEVSRTRR